jgi:hypothetical protein
MITSSKKKKKLYRNEATNFGYHWKKYGELGRDKN